MNQPIDLEQIKADLASPELQMQLQALVALRGYEIATALPLLQSRLDDPNGLVRASVACGLGLKRSPQSYQALQILLQDDEPAVRAAAAGAVAQFSHYHLDRADVAVPDLLVTTFERDEDRLVRSRILDAVNQLHLPFRLFRLCTLALEDKDAALQEQATLLFEQFSDTDMRLSALDHLQRLARSPHAGVRAALARSLQAFDSHRARETLTELRRDPDHRVVAAVLEGLV